MTLQYRQTFFKPFVNMKQRKITQVSILIKFAQKHENFLFQKVKVHNLFFFWHQYIHVDRRIYEIIMPQKP